MTRRVSWARHWSKSEHSSSSFKVTGGPIAWGAALWSDFEGQQTGGGAARGSLDTSAVPRLKENNS